MYPTTHGPLHPLIVWAWHAGCYEATSVETHRAEQSRTWGLKYFRSRGCFDLTQNHAHQSTSKKALFIPWSHGWRYTQAEMAFVPSKQQSMAISDVWFPSTSSTSAACKGTEQVSPLALSSVPSLDTMLQILVILSVPHVASFPMIPSSSLTSLSTCFLLSWNFSLAPHLCPCASAVSKISLKRGIFPLTCSWSKFTPEHVHVRFFYKGLWNNRCIW